MSSISHHRKFANKIFTNNSLLIIQRSNLKEMRMHAKFWSEEGNTYKNLECYARGNFSVSNGSTIATLNYI